MTVSAVCDISCRMFSFEAIQEAQFQGLGLKFPAKLQECRPFFVSESITCQSSTANLKYFWCPHLPIAVHRLSSIERGNLSELPYLHRRFEWEWHVRRLDDPEGISIWRSSSRGHLFLWQPLGQGTLPIFWPSRWRLLWRFHSQSIIYWALSIPEGNLEFPEYPSIIPVFVWLQDIF